MNQTVRERDKNKDDAITMLSDQCITITERLPIRIRKKGTTTTTTTTISIKMMTES